MMPGKNGGALKAGNTVGVGRPPDEFKAMCRALVTREETWKAVQDILTDKAHQHYMSALKWAAEHGYGKPTETMKIDAPEGTTLTQVWTFGKKAVGF